MSNLNSSVLCGKCRAKLQGPEDPQDESVLACPKCGRSDTYAAIMKEIDKYYYDMVDRDIEKLANDELEKANFTTGENPDPPRREYRFILSDI